MLRLDSNQISDLSPLAGLTNLSHLRLDSNQISDLSPLAGLTNLSELYLHSNQISDLSPLAGLTGLWVLWLTSNQISDIYPLVQNPGIGDYDHVYLDDNPLNVTSCTVYIPQLESRGVTVYNTYHDCPYVGCKGSPCSDNQDEDCLSDTTGLICNMAIPATDPVDGTCQYPGKTEEMCDEDADCATALCGPLDILWAPILYGACCFRACMDNPICIAELGFFLDAQNVCKVPLGEPCTANLNAVFFPFFNSCIGGIVRPLGDQGEDCDLQDDSDCNYGLHCVESTCQ